MGRRDRPAARSVASFAGATGGGWKPPSRVGRRTAAFSRAPLAGGGSVSATLVASRSNGSSSDCCMGARGGRVERQRPALLTMTTSAPARREECCFGAVRRRRRRAATEGRRRPTYTETGHRRRQERSRISRRQRELDIGVGLGAAGSLDIDSAVESRAARSLGPDTDLELRATRGRNHSRALGFAGFDACWLDGVSGGRLLTYPGPPTLAHAGPSSDGGRAQNFTSRRCRCYGHRGRQTSSVLASGTPETRSADPASWHCRYRARRGQPRAQRVSGARRASHASSMPWVT
jgi:hypothetical protein